MRGIIDEIRLRIISAPNAEKAKAFSSQDAELRETNHAPRPLSEKFRIHTAINAHAGGANAGLLSAIYCISSFELMKELRIIGRKAITSHASNSIKGCSLIPAIS